MTEQQVFDMRKELLQSQPAPVTAKGGDELAANPGNGKAVQRWWIEHNVTPGAPGKRMGITGGWTAVRFTPQQQVKYGVDAEGNVVNPAVHAAAFKESSRTATATSLEAPLAENGVEDQG